MRDKLKSLFDQAIKVDSLRTGGYFKTIKLLNFFANLIIIINAINIERQKTEVSCGKAGVMKNKTTCFIGFIGYLFNHQDSTNEIKQEIRKFSETFISLCSGIKKIENKKHILNSYPYPLTFDQIVEINDVTEAHCEFYDRLVDTQSDQNKREEQSERKNEFSKDAFENLQLFETHSGPLEKTRLKLLGSISNIGLQKEEQSVLSYFLRPKPKAKDEAEIKQAETQQEGKASPMIQQKEIFPGTPDGLFKSEHKLPDVALDVANETDCESPSSSCPSSPSTSSVSSDDSAAIKEVNLTTPLLEGYKKNLQQNVSARVALFTPCVGQGDDGSKTNGNCHCLLQ